MIDADATRKLVLRYFNSWQEPSDYEEFRSCLADDVVFDRGAGRVAGADELTELTRQTETPWKEVILLASVFDAGEGALFYEGVDKRSGVKTRVGEHVQVQGGRIVRIVAAICPLG